MSNPSAFVSLDKYTKDLTQERVMNFYARKKFERIYVMIKRQIDFIDFVDHSIEGFYWLERVQDSLQRILDLEQPSVAASSPFPSFEKSKFRSVSDGVPCHLEFEGER